MIYLDQVPTAAAIPVVRKFWYRLEETCYDRYAAGHIATTHLVDRVYTWKKVKELLGVQSHYCGISIGIKIPTRLNHSFHSSSAGTSPLGIPRDILVIFLPHSLSKDIKPRGSGVNGNRWKAGITDVCSKPWGYGRCRRPELYQDNEN